ncbi:YncE family protein [Aerosakkonema funiforme]|uniref:YncE family protein n=1 Tax=Aerosakkonema funiforme TaxID=1246630 RepID=UPI0035BB18DE
MLDTSPFFSESFYLSQNQDVAVAVNAGSFSSGLQHFNSFGKIEGRDPSLLFSNRYYLQQNADVAVAVNTGVFRSAFEHFELSGQFEARNFSQLFDTRYYLEQNLDVAALVQTGQSAIAHYLSSGQFEGRDPSRLFDNSFYLTQNQDVAGSIGIDSLTGIKHYLDFGAAEGRIASAEFNSSFYLQQYSDVAAAVNSGAFRSAFQHYAQFGVLEGRYGNDILLNPAAIYVSNNGTANVGDVDRFDPNFAIQKRFVAGNNEGVELDIAGNLYQAGDVTPGAGSIRVISQIGDRPDGDAFSMIRDREIRGAQTQLVNPKGFAIAHTAGFTIIADNGAQNLKVFGTAAGGDVPPVAVTALSANPWDVAYDEESDRLFVALVNGDVSVFDNYIGNGTNIGGGGISRTITPVNAAGNKVSTNLHGIAYSPARNKLVVTDVGAATSAQSPNFNADGRIYIIDNASAANGNVIPSRTIEGPATQMGNPVDMILNGTEVRIAEKAKDLLLIYRNIFDGPSGDIAPDVSIPEIKPESLVAELSDGRMNRGVTDIETTATAIDSLVVTSNPPATGSSEFVAKLSTNLQNQAAFNTSNAVPSLENVTFDLTGDAFITFDNNDTNGGVLIVNRLANSRDGETVNISRDRTITGANTGLVSPKGLEVADNLGLVFVTENNAATPAILAFSTQAQGDIAPVFATTNLGGRRPWDVDYEPNSDRLFVAATDGAVLVYDRYAATQGTNGPTRVITPSDVSGNKISVNLHGIIYVESSDTLLLSDVGSAMSATDGQLFVVNNASTANGNVSVRGIAGPNSMLGNPVDITYDGANLYVAEKSNNLVMRFDDIINQLALIDPLPNQPPIFDIAANLMVTRNRPESVALAPDYLAARPR